MGRPLAKPKISLEEQIEECAKINCTWSEIADVTGMKERTLRRRFGRAYKKGLGNGKQSLKRRMWEIAYNKENVTMCIWLSKQMLGYTDKVEQRVEAENKNHVTYDTQFGTETNSQTIHATQSTIERAPIN